MTRFELARFDGLDPRAERIWRGLEAESKPSYFLTWGWIENWLACLTNKVRPELMVVFDGDAPVAAGFFGRSRLLRHGFIPSRGLFLNTTGDQRSDELTIEHNGLLRGRNLSLSLSDFVDLLGKDWDELFLPALAAEGFPATHLGDPLFTHRVVIEREVSAPFVDLTRVRATHGGYLSLLGSTTRAQIRRAERGFGELRVEIARTSTHALDIYDELVALHEAHWGVRAEGGAFADPWFYGFHRRLIAGRFAHGEIQLIRLSAAGETIGCLYNLIANGQVSFYQSGLAPFDDPRKKAGFVCHRAAVDHNAVAGFSRYDFLGGEARYKQSLSTDVSRLVWARVQRPLVRFALENQLRELTRAIGKTIHTGSKRPPIGKAQARAHSP